MLHVYLATTCDYCTISLECNIYGHRHADDTPALQWFYTCLVVRLWQGRGGGDRVSGQGGRESGRSAAD